MSIREARNRFETGGGGIPGVRGSGKTPNNRVKADIDGTYRKEISQEALEAQGPGAGNLPKGILPMTPQKIQKQKRWVPQINSDDSEEVIQLKRRIQRKEEEIQDILKRMSDFDRQLAKLVDQVVPF